MTPQQLSEQIIDTIGYHGHLNREETVNIVQSIIIASPIEYNNNIELPTKEQWDYLVKIAKQ